MATIDTTPAASYTVEDSTPFDAITVSDGPAESGFRTTEIATGTGTTILANQTEVTIDGGNEGVHIVLDNPDPAAGMEEFSTQNLGIGSSIDGGNPGSGPDITVNDLDLVADVGIGVARALQTQTSNLTAQTTDPIDPGNIDIDNGVSTPTTLEAALSAADGAIDLTNAGTIDDFGSGIGATGSINLTANGTTADIDTGSGANIISSTGSVVMTAGEDINLGDETSDQTEVQGDTGVTLAATAGNFTMNADTSVANVDSGDISITAGGGISMLTSPGSFTAPLIDNLAGTGTITLTAGTGKTLTVARNGNPAIESANGNIFLDADAMVISAGVDAGTARVSLSPASSGRAIDLGAGNSPSALGLTQAELNQITAGVVQVGSGAAGTISINAPIANLANSSVLTLESGDGIVEEGELASLSIPELNAQAGGDIFLDDDNDIGTFAGAANGSISVTDGTNTLTIGEVDGQAGVAAFSGNVDLQADGLVIDDGVSAGSNGIVVIEPYTETVAVDLGGTSSNSPGVLGISDAELNQITASDLVVNAGTGPITLANITQHSYDGLELQTSGATTQTAALTVDALQLTAGTGISVDQSGNSFSTLQFTNASGVVDIVDGASLTVTPSQNYGTTTTLTTTGTFLLDGLYSAGAATITATGDLQLDGELAAGDTVSLTSTAGAIANGGATIDISAPTAVLTAATGIGTLADPLKTQLGTVTASTGTGGIFIANGVSAPATLTIGNGTTGLAVTGASGDIDLTNEGTIDSTNDDQITGLGNITVDALGSGSDLNVSGETSGVYSVDGTGSGTVALSAGRDVNLGTSTQGGVKNTAGTVTVTAGRDFNMTPGADVVGENVTITAGRNFTMNTTPTSGIPNAPEILGGTVNLSAGAGGTMTLASTGATAVLSETSANITLSADNLAIDAGVNANTGDVTIEPVSAGQMISLGTATGGLQLTDAELDEVTGNTLIVGNAIAGEVSIGGSVGAGGLASVGISDQGTGYTSAPAVTISGGGGTGATAIAVLTGGLVTGVQITAQGEGYTSAPTITFSGGGGTGASGAAVLTSPLSASNLTIDTGAGFTEAAGSAIDIGSGVLTIGFDGSGAGATADFTNLTVTAGSLDVTGGAGTDIFKFTAGELVATDEVVGAGGSDHLDMTTAGTINAGGVSGIEIYVLASGGANTLTLTNANFAGVTGSAIRIDGGNGGNTVNASAVTGANQVTLVGGGGQDTFIGGTGNDIFEFTAANLGTSDTVLGGAGSDELLVTTAGTINAGGVSGVETYDLASGGANTLTLTSANFAGVTGSLITVNGGSGGNTINASALTGSDQVKLEGGAGTDIFDFSATSLSASDKVVGGGGSDHLDMTTAGTINAGGVSGVAIYVLASGGANTLTLTNANFAGVTGSAIRIDGGNGGNTVNASAVTGTNQVTLVGGGGQDTFIGGAGNDIFEFTAANLGTSDTVLGGGGSDELLVTTAGTVNAGGVSGVETYDLASGGANTLTLTNANFAGVTGSSIRIDGGSGGNTVNASAVTGANRIVAVGGAGKDVFTGGAGDDIFEFTAANLAATDTVVGGAGSDELDMTTAGTINAGGVSGVETYVLASGGANTLTLTNANFAGVTGSSIRIDGGSGGNTVNASAVTGANRIVAVGGAGKDVFTGGAGNDIFEFTAANLAATDTVAGGAGSDELDMTTAGTVNAGGVSGVETYVLASGGANTLTLTNANFAGVTGSSIRIDGGSGGNTVNASAVTGANRIVAVGGAGKDVFTGGAGNDIFEFTAANLAATDTVAGGAGSDELDMTTAGTVNAGGVSGVETYDLASGGANTLTLTSANFAGTGGTIAVYDGNDGNTVTASTLPAADSIIVHAGTGADTLVGGAGKDLFYAGGNTTMTGGGGADEFIFSGAGTNKITDFAHALDELVFRNAGFNLGVDQGLGTSTPQQISATLFSTDTNGTFSSAASRFAYNTTTGALYYDAGGSSTPGAVQLVATLTTHPAITAADLFFIA